MITLAIARLVWVTLYVYARIFHWRISNAKFSVYRNHQLPDRSGDQRCWRDNHCRQSQQLQSLRLLPGRPAHLGPREQGNQRATTTWSGLCSNQLTHTHTQPPLVCVCARVCLGYGILHASRVRLLPEIIRATFGSHTFYG